MAIGGSEDKSANGEILDTFVDLAGGANARIVVIPTASEEPEDTVREYTETFGEHGVTAISALEVEKREDANADPAIRIFEDATGIFITGGSQERLVELLVGTRVMEAIQARNREGVAVAGTSSGASILADHAIAGGTGLGEDSNASAAKKAEVEVVAGLGIFPGVLIDQHFSERGRIGRLLSAFAANPGLVGIGLDEDTAVLFNGRDEIETYGNGMVTIIAGRNATTNYFHIEPGELLTVLNCELHALGPGHRFNLFEQIPVPEPEHAD
jgi:cyanophycinase